MVGCAGCGGSTAPRITPSYSVKHAPGTNQPQIVLTPVSANSLGLQTARAAAMKGRRGTTATIPYSAIVYAPDGASFAFINRGPLTYREVPIRVRTIIGTTAFLASGPRPGAEVVTVGAEELFGAVTGVLQQT